MLCFEKGGNLNIYVIIITIASILLWIGITLRVLRFVGFLKKPKLFTDVQLPFLSIIISARNEEQDLAQCVHSMAKQDYPEFEIIIVNDNSTDKTGSIADELAKQYSNVNVIHNPELPDGWKGKTNAMHNGSIIAKGEYLLFSDADMMHSAGSLRTLMSDMLKHSIVFYSILPDFIWKGLLESIFAPAMRVGFAKYSSISIEDIESDNSAAVGGLMIVKRAIYDKIGGHTAIKGSIIDDIDLASHFKKNGYGTYFRYAPHLVKVRMFKGNRNLITGFSKNLMFAFSKSPYIVFPLILLGIFTLVPGVFSITYGLVTGNILITALGIIHYLYIYISFLLFRDFNKPNYLYMTMYPIACVLLSISLLISFFNLVFRKSIVWRNRRILQ